MKTRTSNLLIRSQMLYPIELRVLSPKTKDNFLTDLPLARQMVFASRRCKKTGCAARPMAACSPRGRYRLAPSCPAEHLDPVNARILAVSEDKIAGFSP